MAYRMVYLRIRCNCYNSGYGKDSGWVSDTDQAAFEEVSRRIFQELGWDLHTGRNGVCDTVTKGHQNLYLHPTSFSGVLDEANIQPLQEQLSKARTFSCYQIMLTAMRSTAPHWKQSVGRSRTSSWNSAGLNAQIESPENIV